jgi:hypothetical protein
MPRVGNIEQKQTAEILGILNQNGLLTNDAELKVWVAKAFGLPERSIGDYEETEKEGKPDEEDGNDGDGGHLSEGRFSRRRPLMEAEERVLFSEMKRKINDAEEKALKTIGGIEAQQKAEVSRKAAKIIDSGDVSGVAGLSVGTPKGSIRELEQIALERLEESKADAAAEVNVLPTATPSNAKAALRAKIAVFVKEREDRLTDAVRKRIIDIVNEDIGKAAGLFEIEKVIDAANSRTRSGLVGQVVMTPINEGRYLTFDDIREQTQSLIRSEILDDRCCNLCLSMDGRAISPSDPFAQLGQLHDSCRGMWVAALKTDANPPEPKELPKSILSRFETVGGVPVTNAIKPMTKPVYTKDSLVAQKVKDGELDA